MKQTPSPTVPSAQASFAHGLRALRSGQAVAALPHLQAAVAANPSHADALHALGAALIAVGSYADACRALSRAVALRPNDAPAWRDLGLAYDRRNAHDRAADAYARAVALAPKFGDTHHRLGELHAAYGRTAQAADSFERAAGAHPKTTVARLLRADAQLLRGDIAGAESWARKAAALDPSSAAAHGTLGGVLYADGRFEAAAGAFERALAIEPRLAKCWDGLVHCRRYADPDDPVFDRLRSVLGRPDLADGDRLILHFALGKIYDDCGDYARAMEQFDAGNAMRGRGLTFDRRSFATLVDQTIARFTPAFVAEHAAAGTRDARPVFIVGMYRSGTTLVEQILSSHPEVAAGGEITELAPGEIDIDSTTGGWDEVRAGAAARRYLARLGAIGPGAARVTDKLPFNFLRLGALHTLLPEARFIHCMRDPLDTCLSIHTTLFNTPVPFAPRQDDLVFAYREYLRIMAHWRETLPAGTLLDIRYENLVADHEAGTRRLVAFAGLDWSDRCLMPERNERAVTTSSAWQARQPVYGRSVGRWRHYEPWLGPLLALMPGDAGS